MKLKKLIICMLALAMVLTLPACGQSNDATKSGSPTTLRVGSKDFTESLVVGEVYSLALEDAGYKVERKLNIAGSIVHTAIINNEIDLYPEYTGTGLLTILKMELMTDPDEVYRVVKEEYEKQFNLIWLDSSKANDAQGLVMRADLAKELGIVTISDFQAQTHQIRFATQGEFDQRDDGIPGLEKIYGKFDFLSSRVYDTGLKYQLMQAGEVDAAPAYTTEGQLVNADLFTLLVDDKHMWPPYYLAPVVRSDVLDKNPDIAEILNAISAALDTETVTALNAQVDVDKREYEEVAQDFWKTLKNQ